MAEKKWKVRIFYERTLPRDVDLSKASMVERKYMSNPKLGHVYEIRKECVSKPKQTKEKLRTPVQENKLWLWKNEGELTRYLNSRGHRYKKQHDIQRLLDRRRASENLEYFNSRTLTTYEDLRPWSPKRAEQFRPRSLSVSGETRESLNDSRIFRVRSQSISGEWLCRRPFLATKTSNWQAPESNTSVSSEAIGSISNVSSECSKESVLKASHAGVTAGNHVTQQQQQ